MKIGVTGGTGVLGRILLKKLKKKNFKVLNFNSDIRNSSNIKKWVQRNSFDIIFHLAALVSVSECEKNPLKACEINIGGTIKILDAISELKKKPLFFFTSTSHVYKFKKKPLLETDTIAPRSFYGYTKWLCEKMLENYSAQHNIAYCCVRIFSFYDKFQSKNFLFPAIKNKIENIKKKKFYIVNANNIIDIQKAENVVKTILELFKKKFKGVVNIGTGKGISIKKFSKSLTKKKIKIYTNKKKKIKIIANIKKLNSIIKQ
jgi:nucleoside-diphosphate-sugar epimerase